VAKVNPSGRFRLQATPLGFEIAIDPLIRQPRWRRAAVLFGAATFGALLFAARRLFESWEHVLRGMPDLPTAWLALLTLACFAAVPATSVGIIHLLSTEEFLTVSEDRVRREVAMAGRTVVEEWDIERLECWRRTILPLRPWWTWTVVRLAARVNGKLFPVGVATRDKEKKYLAELLARHTGRPVVTDRQAWRNRRHRSGRNPPEEPGPPEARRESR
jgi:hypothetical protein